MSNRARVPGTAPKIGVLLRNQPATRGDDGWSRSCPGRRPPPTLVRGQREPGAIRGQQVMLVFRIVFPGRSSDGAVDVARRADQAYHIAGQSRFEVTNACPAR